MQKIKPFAALMLALMILFSQKSHTYAASVFEFVTGNKSYFSDIRDMFNDQGFVTYNFNAPMTTPYIRLFFITQGENQWDCNLIQVGGSKIFYISDASGNIWQAGTHNSICSEVTQVATYGGYTMWTALYDLSLGNGTLQSFVQGEDYQIQINNQLQYLDQGQNRYWSFSPHTAITQAASSGAWLSGFLDAYRLYIQIGANGEYSTEGDTFVSSGVPDPTDPDPLPDQECTITNLSGCIGYLFYPSKEKFQQFADLSAIISQKPPFGWFQITVDAIQELQFDETDTPFSFPYIRDTVKYMLWIMLVVALYKRVTNFTI